MKKNENKNSEEEKIGTKFRKIILKDSENKSEKILTTNSKKYKN